MVPRLQRGGDRLGEEHGPHREPAAQRLGERHYIGHHPRLLVREQRAGASQATLHFVEHEGRPARVAQLAQEAEPFGIQRPHASLALHRLHDDGRRAVGRDHAIGDGPILERHDVHAGDERLERLAVVGPVSGRERGEQPPVERAGERHDLGLA